MSWREPPRLQRPPRACACFRRHRSKLTEEGLAVDAGPRCRSGRVPVRRCSSRGRVALLDRTGVMRTRAWPVARLRGSVLRIRCGLVLTRLRMPLQMRRRLIRAVGQIVPMRWGSQICRLHRHPTSTGQLRSARVAMRTPRKVAVCRMARRVSSLTGRSFQLNRVVLIRHGRRRSQRRQQITSIGRRWRDLQ